MFSQRKTYWKRPLVLLVLFSLIGGGYWFIQGDKPADGDEADHEPLVQIIDTNTGKNSEDTDETHKGQGDNSTPSPESDQPEKFFLVKKFDDAIDVYYYKGEGEPLFIKNTGIEFSLLSKEDQAKFIEGIIIKTEDELNELLQDFGS